MTQRISGLRGPASRGFARAMALIQRGFHVTICEQAETLRETGAGGRSARTERGCSHPRACPTQPRDLAVEPTAKTIRLWNSGETWSLFDLGAMSVAEYGFPYLMVHRGDLHTTLANAVKQLDPDAIRQGAGVVEVENCTDGVTVSLSRRRTRQRRYPDRSRRHPFRRKGGAAAPALDRRISPAGRHGAESSHHRACCRISAVTSARTGSAPAGTW